MFGALVAAREAMDSIAGAFDPLVVSPEHCRRVVTEASKIERLARTITSLAATRAQWEGQDRSPAHALARATGTSVKDATDTLATAEKLAALPSLDAAARRGDVSLPQAAAIASATDDDTKAAALIGTAARTSLGELRDECLRVRAASLSHEERHRRIHADRRLRTWTDVEGGWNLSVRHTVEAGAAVMAALEPIRDQLFRAATAQESSEAYAADALVELARGAKVKRGDAKVIVRVDWDALVRGWPIDGEVCEIAGVGPVPVSVADAMCASGDAFLTAVVTRGVDVHSVAHLGRQATAHQRTALQWRDPGCSVAGCNAVAHLEIDHRVDWARSKVTLLQWLDRLCTHHHDLKTQRGWALVHGVGKREMVPPDDPRHPKRSQGAECRPALAVATIPP